MSDITPISDEFVEPEVPDFEDHIEFAEPVADAPDINDEDIEDDYGTEGDE